MSVAMYYVTIIIMSQLYKNPDIAINEAELKYVIINPSDINFEPESDI